MFPEKTNYVGMLQLFLESQLQQDGTLVSVIYQLDGAPGTTPLCKYCAGLPERDHS